LYFQPLGCGSGFGYTRSRTDRSGGGRFILLNSLAKQLHPFSTQLPTSSITVASVNRFKYNRSDSSTLVTIVWQRAPESDLFVRPVFRACAGFRSVRSASLFVGPGTTGIRRGVDEHRGQIFPSNAFNHIR
jgi:hypothetical protein